ncbi:hypothetical protein COY93_00220 [Candidatus Uhrbacteria bacterium CG_4_10_14_0_8_um_filter_58_22]|uniref:DUF2207 domain-containing protein n=1 Tax=Candidatus Uhrbacteria bacterium CG_4_10_14_0_8_um_filter_58_22 TaxID=1975029 RepID=A0A2M7QBY4_9BACT|nr:MAG: hypothetical protein AUJ19_05025 [Parcubacteria group bacterium CG1_02_58_44]PIY63380.1 MAG: hypothetical protein COY93_00220 [Candidatus Uhrbacteria bacterium CG_4_10_14_0_8_um_filter_58_22]
MKRSTNIRRGLVGLLFGLALLLPSLQPLSAQSQPEYEEVRAFHSDLTVGSDGTLTVVETIDYAFAAPRHGIFRDLPIRYELDDGEQVIVPIEVVSVDGWPYELEKSKSMVRIRIGDPDRTVTGIQRYVITYRATGAVRYFDDHDELYWNVTGNDWEVPLSRIGATVRLPDAVDGQSVTHDCFTGGVGSTERDCEIDPVGRTVSFLSDDPLTLVVGWGPKGAVAFVAPRHPEFWADYVRPNIFGFAVAIFLPVLAFAFLFGRWRKYGRDPEGAGTLVVQYDPPDKLTPAEVSTVFSERVGTRDIIVTIVDLAVRGYLKIAELPKAFLSQKDFEFTLLKPGFVKDELLKQHEVKILNVMFGSSEKVTLRQLTNRYAFDGSLPLIRQRLYGQAVADRYFSESPDKTRIKYRSVGGGLILLAVVFGFILDQGWLADDLLNGTLVAVGIALVGILVMVFGSFMPRKTSEGVRVHDHARGFREYLSTAEKYRLKWQESENVFERWLPYAMAFGVVDKWSEAFKSIALPQPGWYEGQSLSAGFSAVVFSRSIGSLQSGLIRAVSSTPRRSSSGSGFGGSSGGGFGGGGGGSW